MGAGVLAVPRVAALSTLFIASLLPPLLLPPPPPLQMLGGRLPTSSASDDLLRRRPVAERSGAGEGTGVGSGATRLRPERPNRGGTPGAAATSTAASSEDESEAASEGAAIRVGRDVPAEEARETSAGELVPAGCCCADQLAQPELPSASACSTPAIRSKLGESVLLRRVNEPGDADCGESRPPQTDPARVGARLGAKEDKGESRLDSAGEMRPSTAIEETEFALLHAQQLPRREGVSGVRDGSVNQSSPSPSGAVPPSICMRPLPAREATCNGRGRYVSDGRLASDSGRIMGGKRSHRWL